MENDKELELLENELVPVYTTDTGEKVVYGRDLWEVLGSKQEFTAWMKKRVFECDAVENEDYEVFDKIIKNSKGGRPTKEYIIHLDTAKEMAMLERNDKGKQVRKYFIEIEKRYRLGFRLPQTFSEALRWYADEVDKNTRLKEEIKKLENDLQIREPFVEAALQIRDSTGFVDMGETSKILRDHGIDIGRNRLFEVLREHNILMENNNPYQRYVESGIFVAKLIKTANNQIKSKTFVTGKGLLWLNKKLREWFGIEPNKKINDWLEKQNDIAFVSATNL